MVNGPSDTATRDRRERPRVGAEHAPALGASNPNPFGDLVTLQHLSARLAKALKPVFEGLLRKPLRTFAEPIAVQRWADYKAERPQELTAWQALALQPGKGRAMLVMDGRFVLEMLDCFFGGEGEAPSPLPSEFTAAAEAVVARAAQAVAAPLEAAWEPVARIGFTALPAASLAAAPDLAGDDPVLVTRFGIAAGDRKPEFIDLLYPVAALKPHAAALMSKVHDVESEVEPEWRAGLTRAVMGVRFPVRSVLAEPVMPLGRVMDLKVGDVIAIDLVPEVPVMVAARRLGTGLVGTANGRAAVRLTSIEPINPEDFR